MYFRPFQSGGYSKAGIFNWDAASYQLYLPATFIYKDLFQLKFYDYLDAKYGFTVGVPHYAIFEHPETHRKFIKYTCGTALFQLPGFLLTSAYCKVAGLDNDGYSHPFRQSAAMTTKILVLAALLLLGLFLRRYYDDLPIALSLVALGVGTNLYYYTVYQQGFSHPYLFFLVSLALYITPLWYEKPTFWRSVLIGVAVGWATLT